MNRCSTAIHAIPLLYSFILRKLNCMDRLDFRSDTVTWPTEAMRVAMAGATVGDDVYGEDPTVNALEALAAEKVGKEAGLFVSSGTMGNLVAILAHAGRGDEAILGNDSHVFSYEAGGMAVLGSITPRPLPTDSIGCMNLDDIRNAIREDDPHLPQTRLILVENSYGAKNGAPIPLNYFADIRQIANENGLAVHMDGARLFNAAIALGKSADVVTHDVDSVTFCLSKGLSAPVGSVLCGSHEFIYRARRARKILGGGMRQVGVLAAAGIVALNGMVDRLAVDHDNAYRLACGLAQIPGVVIDPEAIKTNIVYFSLDDSVERNSFEIAKRMQSAANIWVGANGERSFRAVTHYWIDSSAVDLFLDTLSAIVRNT